MKIAFSIVGPNGNYTFQDGILLCHAMPRTGEAVELDDQGWFQVVGVCHRAIDLQIGHQHDPAFAPKKRAEFGVEGPADEPDGTEFFIETIVLLKQVAGPPVFAPSSGS